ncbi:MAG: hypothetical protein ABIS18_12000 [Actinomycetota bacterium]
MGSSIFLWRVSLEVMSVGYLLGGFFNRDDPKTTWLITGVGVIALFGLMFLIGRYLKRES